MHTLIAGSDTAPTLVFAHGAGAAMDSEWMNDMSALLVARSLRVVRFEFPYMAQKREGKKARAPDRMPVLQACYREVAHSLGHPQQLFLGGKSMGSRVATHLADALGVRGVFAFGYPFHPAKKPTELRVAHLTELKTPCLFLQGTRDALGLPDEIASYPLSPAIRVHYLADGDHSLEPRKSSGRTLAQNMAEAADALAAFVRELSV